MTSVVHWLSTTEITAALGKTEATIHTTYHDDRRQDEAENKSRASNSVVGAPMASLAVSSHDGEFAKPATSTT